MRNRGFYRGELALLLSVTAGLTMYGVAKRVEMNRAGRDSRFYDETGGRGDARWRQCQANLHTIGLGLLQYTMDYDDKFPPASISLSSIGPDSFGYGWVDGISAYMPTMKSFQCPTESHLAATDPKRPGYSDYWYNLNCTNQTWPGFGKVTMTIMAGDGDGGAPNSNSRYALKGLPAAWRRTPGSPARRHVDGANYLYVDGHVHWSTPDAVGTKTSDISPTFTWEKPL